MPATLCHHIRSNGKRCGSPALRHEQFCFYHHPTRRPPTPRGRKPRSPVFHLPNLTNRDSIQRAVVKIVSRTASGRLSPKSARLFLFTLQLANRALPGDPRPLQSHIALSRKTLRLPATDLAAVLKSIRPPRRMQKKCTESKDN